MSRFFMVHCVDSSVHRHSDMGPVTKPTLESCKKCAYDCAQLQYTIQHRTVLIISPLTSRQAS